jgi:hypothetical protein
MSATAVVDAANTTRTYALAGPLAGDADLIADGGEPCRGIRVGAAGDIAIVDAGGASTTIPAVLAGETLRVRAAKLLAAGTTAQKITVLW